MAAIVLVDDHVLLRSGLAALIKSLGYDVIFEADNGNDFCEKMVNYNIPDIVLLDINMPVMDGYQTCKWLHINHPNIKVLALSMYDNEAAIITMIKCGAKGYILKDSSPAQLKAALHDLVVKGYHYSEVLNGKLIFALNKMDEDTENKQFFTDREIEFLKHSCTELSYKQIADIMQASPRTIDGYRDTLFEKLNIKTRVGLAIYAIKSGLIDIDKV